MSRRRKDESSGPDQELDAFAAVFDASDDPEDERRSAKVDGLDRRAEGWVRRNKPADSAALPDMRRGRSVKEVRVNPLDQRKGGLGGDKDVYDKGTLSGIDLAAFGRPPHVRITPPQPPTVVTSQAVNQANGYDKRREQVAPTQFQYEEWWIRQESAATNAASGSRDPKPLVADNAATPLRKDLDPIREAIRRWGEQQRQSGPVDPTNEAEKFDAVVELAQTYLQPIPEKVDTRQPCTHCHLDLSRTKKPGLCRWCQDYKKTHGALPSQNKIQARRESR